MIHQNSQCVLGSEAIAGVGNPYVDSLSNKEGTKRERRGNEEFTCDGEIGLPETNEI